MLHHFQSQFREVQFRIIFTFPETFTMSAARPALFSPPPLNGRRRLPARVTRVPSPNIVSVIFFESPETFFVVRQNLIKMN